MDAALEPAMAAPEAPESWVGHRVRVAGQPATVRWGPGPLQAPPKKPAEGEAPESESSFVEVVGVEYDEPGQGKHDGTYQGARLFTCAPGFGSFVKRDKVARGNSFQRALADKYFENVAAPRGTRLEDMNSLDYVDSKGRAKEFVVEFVGRYGVEQRQKRLEGFVETSLADTDLESRYPDEVWEGDWSLPNLKSLWLDRTLLSEWPDIIAIFELCPDLEWLSLAKNRLLPLPGGVLAAPRFAPARPQFDRIAFAPFVSKIRTLVLNGTMVQWDDLFAVDAANQLPCLEHLHLAMNNLSEGVPVLDVPDGSRRPLPRLISLVLDGNSISDWRVIQRAIASFPTLQALHLNSNLLGETLEGLAELAADEQPRRLTSLFLNENRLASWGAVGALAAYALLELKLQRNPLTEGEVPVASPQLLRQVLIALMPTLLRLNASEVPLKERAMAERYLLSVAQSKSVMMESLRESCNLGAHLGRLHGVHGEVVGGADNEEAQANRSALVHALVEITMRPIGAAILHQQAVCKRVPHTMTVAELKRLCHSIFKAVPLERVKLLLADPALPFGVPFDDENRELGFYGVCNGAEIRIDDLQDMKNEKIVKRVENLAGRMEDEV